MRFIPAGALVLGALLVSAPGPNVIPSAARAPSSAPMRAAPIHAVKQPTTVVRRVDDRARDAIFGLLLLLSAQHGSHMP